MKTTSQRKVDEFSLFNTTSLPDSTFLETKHFLSEKFLISFDSIKKAIIYSQDKHPMDNIIEIIYNAVYSNAFGFSLDMVNDTTYGVYTRKNTRLSTNHTLLQNLESQIKIHCIIEALYTIRAILDSAYIPLSKLPLPYTSKVYINNNSRILRHPFSDYSSADNDYVDKFRYAYNSLLNPLSQISPDPKLVNLITSKFESREIVAKDINDLRIEKFPNYLLANAFNFSNSNSSYQVQEFLKEFSFDLLVNQMQSGFNLVKKWQTMQKNTQDQNNFRREVRRFLTDIETIDNNFYSTSDSTIETLLYNWKKDHVFHLNMLFYLINSENNYTGMPYAENLLHFPTFASISPLIALLENTSMSSSSEGNIIFLLNYLAGITIPVFSYTFFIALCEYYKYDLEDLRDMLIVYLCQHSIEMETNNYYSATKHPNTKNIDQLGKAMSSVFFAPPYFYVEPFDSSFTYNLPYSEEYIDDPKYIQSEIGLKYYENIIF